MNSCATSRPRDRGPLLRNEQLPGRLTLLRAIRRRRPCAVLSHIGADGKYFMMVTTGMTALIRLLGNGGSKTNRWPCNYRRSSHSTETTTGSSWQGFFLHCEAIAHCYLLQRRGIGDDFVQFLFGCRITAEDEGAGEMFPISATGRKVLGR